MKWNVYDYVTTKRRESHSTLILKVNIFARHSFCLCVCCKLPPFSGSEIKVMRLLFSSSPAHSETTLIWFSCLYNFPCWMSLLLKLKRERDFLFLMYNKKHTVWTFFLVISLAWSLSLTSYSQWSRKKVYLFHRERAKGDPTMSMKWR